jgi:uncharacterized protein (TIGR03435 family)
MALRKLALLLASRVLACGVFACGIAVAQPQSTSSQRPQFEVASIKRNKQADPTIMLSISEGRFRATNIPLQLLLTMGYGIQDLQLAGAPGWLLSERYDVIAKAEGKAGYDELAAMLQPLFEDRLQLRFHTESKELPVYALVVIKPGKLPEATGECDPPPSSSGPPDPSKLPHGPCGNLFITPARMYGQKVPMSRLLDPLSRLTNRIVLDKTNLTGRYNVDLRYTLDRGAFPPPGDAPPGLPPLPPVDPDGPSLFAAVEQQLGLKLDSQKGPVPVMVIDHVERPSEN